MKFLRSWSYNRKLQHKLGLKSSQSTPIQKGRFVGIVFDYNNEQEVLYIKNLAAQYKIDGFITKVLGFVDEPIDTEKFDFRAFSRKNLGWDGIPEHPDVDEFLSRDYDLLFFAIRSYNPAMAYLAKLSTARIKLGTFHPELKNDFDILLDINLPCKINDIFDQFLTHLKIVSN